jgi:hypothetical protein
MENILGFSFFLGPLNRISSGRVQIKIDPRIPSRYNFKKTVWRVVDCGAGLLGRIRDE